MPLGLNLNLQGVDTKFPSINPGEYKASIIKVEGKESQNKPGLFMLAVEQQLEEPATSTEGKPIAVGFKFHSNITLPSDNDPDNKEIRERTTAAFIDAVFGCTKENRPVLTDDLLPSMVGKVVKVGIAMRKKKEGEGDQYGDTQVSYYKAVVA